jgi:hypothetical protein
MGYSFSCLILKGRNPSGAVGLFPQTYTTAIPPTEVTPAIVVDHVSPDVHTPTTLHPLREEPETVSMQGSPNPDAPDSTQPGQNDEVMKATMTDVQKAIEQLGKNDVDGARSFSFASSREGDWTDRELDSDQEMDRDTDADGETWHTTARQKLAEKARRANERAAVEQATPMRRSSPPIEVELSDESEAEDDDNHHRHPGSSLSRQHPHIIEENEDDEIQAPNQHVSSLEEVITTNGASVSHKQSGSSVVNYGQEKRTSLPTPTLPSVKNTDTPAYTVKEHVRQGSSSSSTRPATIESRDPQTPSRRSSSLPSPTATSITSVGIEQTLTAANPSSPLKSSISPQPDSTDQQSPTTSSTSPSEWTLEEVVEWLKMKGFDQFVCDKFIGKSCVHAISRLKLMPLH